MRMRRTTTPLARGVIVFQRSIGIETHETLLLKFVLRSSSRLAILVQVEGHGHREVHAHRPAVQGRRLVLPLLDRPDRRRRRGAGLTDFRTLTSSTLPSAVMIASRMTTPSIRALRAASG